MKESKIMWYVLRQILVCFDYCEHIVPRCPSKSRIMQHVFSLSVWWCTMAGLGNICPKIIRKKKLRNGWIYHKNLILTKYSWNKFLKVCLKCENWQICISIIQTCVFFHFQSDGEDELKKRQLMELAIINGTYRDSQSKNSSRKYL